MWKNDICVWDNTYCGQGKEFVNLKNKIEFMEKCFIDVKSVIQSHNDTVFDKLDWIYKKIEELDNKFIRLDIYNEKEKNIDKRINSIENNITWIVRLILWSITLWLLTLLYNIK